MRKSVLAAALAAVVMLSGCSGVSQENYNLLVEENSRLQSENSALQGANSRLEQENKAAEDRNKNATDAYNTLKEEYDALKEETAPYMELSEAERAAEVERLKKEEEERKAKEEAARREEEAKGYETGITFKDISRSPDEYTGKKVKFTGRVVQLVYEGRTISELRMSTNGNYDDVIYVTYDPSTLDVRVLEDDNITIYGTFSSIKTYTTVLGSEKSLPHIRADIIEIND